VAQDGGSRGHKVFRHQLGTLHQEDALIYEEKNPDYSVSGKRLLLDDLIWRGFSR
jgi:protease II